MTLREKEIVIDAKAGTRTIQNAPLRADIKKGKRADRGPKNMQQVFDRLENQLVNSKKRIKTGRR